MGGSGSGSGSGEGSKSVVFVCCVITVWVAVIIQSCEGKKCKPSGYLVPKKYHDCNTGDMSDCCQVGQRYPQYRCSPAVSSKTRATLTLNSFEKGKDGGGPSSCDNQFHSDDQPWLALSTGWFSAKSNCFRNVTISGRGKTAVATVIDECDSFNGCDEEHNYEPPCENDIVDASKTVWETLGVSSDDNDYGYMGVTWKFL